MKVQRKCNPFRIWEVIEESPNHYIVSDGSPRGEGLAYCIPKADYEPVGEWKDVTHECTLEASATGAYCIYRLGYAVNPGNTTHRVTCEGSTFKVEVKR